MNSKKNLFPLLLKFYLLAKVLASTPISTRPSLICDCSLVIVMSCDPFKLFSCGSFAVGEP